MTKNNHLAFSLLPLFAIMNVVNVTNSHDSNKAITLSAAIQVKHAKNKTFNNPPYLESETVVDLIS